MGDDYQVGSNEEWLKHSNAEMARLVKRCQRQVMYGRLCCLVLLAALVWVIYKYGQRHPLSDLLGG